MQEAIATLGAAGKIDDADLDEVEAADKKAKKSKKKKRAAEEAAADQPAAGQPAALHCKFNQKLLGFPHKAEAWQMVQQADSCAHDAQLVHATHMPALFLV